MKKAKSPIYFRYEFSDEAGLPEGGDIFKLSSMTQVQDMAEDILKVAHADGVTVNLTIGEEVPFFGFLKTVGMSRKEVEREIVGLDLSVVSSDVKTTKKNTKTKSKTKAKKK